MLVSCPWGWAHLTVIPSYLFAPASLELPESQTTSYSATSPQQSTEDRLLTALAKYLLSDSGTGLTGSATLPSVQRLSWATAVVLVCPQVLWHAFLHEGVSSPPASGTRT